MNKPYIGVPFFVSKLLHLLSTSNCSPSVDIQSLILIALSPEHFRMAESPIWLFSEYSAPSTGY